MIRYDRVLVAPDADELDDALGDAVEAVNRVPDGPAIPWSVAEYEAVRGRLGRHPEGQADWHNPRSVELDQERRLRVVWWADFLGRRHVRVRGWSTDRWLADGLRERHFPPGRPLLLIYPEAGFSVSDGSSPRGLLVLCPCGAAGTPEEIAWMGTECGPCHDRRAAGELPARAWDAPAFDGHGLSSPDVATVEDGGGRLRVVDTWRVIEWDLATGRQVAARERGGPAGEEPDERFAVVERSPDGAEYALTHAGVVVFRRGAGADWRLLREDDAEAEVSPTTLASDYVGLLAVSGGVVVRDRHRLRHFEAPGGRLLRSRELLTLVDAGEDRVLSPDRRVLVLAGAGDCALSLVRVPELTHERWLQTTDGPREGVMAGTDHWLILVGNRGVRLVPWPPLLEWYNREAGR